MSASTASTSPASPPTAALTSTAATPLSARSRASSRPSLASPTPTRKRTVNCGVIGGGTRSNVIAAEAFTEVDVRIAKATDAKRVDRLFRSLKVTDKACRLTVSGGINRPPMERTPGTVALFKQAKRLAAELGFALDEASTGGGSDGNFTSALGIPTLDGMGAVGDGAHAAHESIVIEHLAPRTALLAAMIAAK